MARRGLSDQGPNLNFEFRLGNTPLEFRVPLCGTLCVQRRAQALGNSHPLPLNSLDRSGTKNLGNYCPKENV